MVYIVYFIIICVALHFVRKFLNRFKFPKISSVSVFTGGIKVGKSAVSLAVALKNYRSIHRIWRIKNAFRSMMKKPLLEEPLFYSNIPLRIPYVPLTTDHLLRKVRFNFGSVVFLDEASLLADSQLITDKKVNFELLVFFKLFGHETHGGKCIINTHSLTDLHYAAKRVVSQYFYVQSTSKYIPFLCLVNMREERYSEDGSVLNTYEADVEDSLKHCLMRKSIFKYYDPCCFSPLTDNLPTKNDMVYIQKGDSLKADHLASFRPDFSALKFADKIEDKIDLETGEVLKGEEEK